MRVLAGSCFGLLVSFSVASLAVASDTTPLADTVVFDVNITLADLVQAQKDWSDVLIKISQTHEREGVEQARAVARELIDDLYALDYGPVLFKPTLAGAGQNFRMDLQGALAYFVGGDPEFPRDSGFALKGWQSVEVENAGIYIAGDIGMTMGRVTVVNGAGERTVVDKSWVFRKMSDQSVRIILHHSSLPFVHE